MNIPDNLKILIDDVIAYVGSETNDWMRIKTELIKSLPWEERTRFSRRHHSTKKQTPNGFDELVMAYWTLRTGVQPVILPEKLHDPVRDARNKKGWGLSAFNENRTRENKRLRNDDEQKIE